MQFALEKPDNISLPPTNSGPFLRRFTFLPNTSEHSDVATNLSATSQSDRTALVTDHGSRVTASRFATHRKTGFGVTRRKQTTASFPVRNKKRGIGFRLFRRNPDLFGPFFRPSRGHFLRRFLVPPLAPLPPAFFGTQSVEKAFAFSSPVLFSLLQLNLPGRPLSATLSLLARRSRCLAQQGLRPQEAEPKNPFEVLHGR